MTSIKLDEVSLVDHPAHMVEGFAVIKAAENNNNEALFEALRKGKMPTEKIEDVLNGLSVDEIVKALAEDKRDELVKALAPEAVVEVDEDITKSAPEELRNEFAKRDQQIADLMAEVEKARGETATERDTRLDAEAITKSKTEFDGLAFEHEKVAPALRKFAAENADAATVITEMLKAVSAQAKTAGLFEEIGTGAGSSADDTAGSKLETMAKARAAQDGVAFHKAYQLVVDENPELVSDYYKENN
jgi:hypothetical protein